MKPGQLNLKFTEVKADKKLTSFKMKEHKLTYIEFLILITLYFTTGFNTLCPLE